MPSGLIEWWRARGQRTSGSAPVVTSAPEPSSRSTWLMADDIEALLEQVQRAYEQQSRLTRGIGHDFKSPLASILRLSESLAAGDFGEMTDDQAEACRLIASSARHLMAIAQALYAVGDAREDDVRFGATRVDLVVTLERIADANRPAARAKGVAIALDLPEGEVPAVCAARGAIERILGNIIDNAVKFTDSGTVTIICRRIGETAEITVSDTGIGIPADELDSIGAEFVRASNARGVSGSGVGLAVSRHLLENAGGSMRVTSRLGEGSTFVIALPVALGPEESC